MWLGLCAPHDQTPAVRLKIRQDGRRLCLAIYCDCVVTQNIHSSTKDGYLVCTALPPGISSFASYIPFKSSAIQILHPLKIFDDLLWCGYGHFLNLHISMS